MKRTLIPTDSELEILQILWNYGPSTVRFVHEELSKTKQVGYTTTLKLMQIMAEKGIAKRDTSIRTHVYLSNLKQSETQKSLLKKLSSKYSFSFCINYFFIAHGNLIFILLGHFVCC